MIRAFILSAAISAVAVFALSFTSMGQLVSVLFAAPLRDGVDGLRVLWVVSLLLGAPFLGYVFVLLFPGDENRLRAVTSLTGTWTGIVGSSCAVTLWRFG